MSKEDCQIAIREARELLEEAKEKIAYCIETLEDRATYECYILDYIDSLLGEGNPYDTSIRDVEVDIENMEDAEGDY